MEHHFDPGFATEYGLEAAIIINRLSFWIDKNRVDNRNYKEGYYWSYESIAGLHEHFPYLTEYSIRKSLERLEEYGFVKSACYNAKAFDKSKWYTLTEEGEAAVTGYKAKNKAEFEKRQNGFSENAKRSKNDNSVFDESIESFSEIEESFVENDKRFVEIEKPIPVIYNTVNNTIKDTVIDNNPLTPLQGESDKAEPPKKPLVRKKSNKLEAVPEESLEGFSDTFKEALRGWFKYKCEQGSRYVPTGWEALVKKCKTAIAGYGEQAVIECIENAKSNDFQGISWFKLGKTDFSNNNGGNDNGKRSRNSWESGEDTQEYYTKHGLGTCL